MGTDEKRWVGLGWGARAMDGEGVIVVCNESSNMTHASNLYQ